MRCSGLPLALALLASGPALAAAPQLVNTGYFGGVAISGYDTVAYFTDGKAMKGSEEFAYDWLGTPWYFASDEHRSLFESDPAKYAPQFGGYCALGVSYGHAAVNVDPEAFRIIDGKLYLNYDTTYVEELDGPGRDEAIARAEAKWPDVAAAQAAK
ncbi:MAG: YHS domain-containing (seleno)protein [Geminicoccaceae bacterium]